MKRSTGHGKDFRAVVDTGDVCLPESEALDDGVDKIDTIRVDRLLEAWDPFDALGIERDGIVPVEDCPYQDHLGWDGRDAAYHRNRIGYFLSRLLKNEGLDPIVLDNVCSFGVIHPEPIVEDGNHRLAAAVLAGVKKIRVSYSGRVDVLRWLEGKRKRPEF